MRSATSCTPRSPRRTVTASLTQSPALGIASPERATRALIDSSLNCEGRKSGDIACRSSSSKRAGRSATRIRTMATGIRGAGAPAGMAAAVARATMNTVSSGRAWLRSAALSSTRPATTAAEERAGCGAPSSGLGACRGSCARSGNCCCACAMPRSRPSARSDPAGATLCARCQCSIAPRQSRCS